MMNIFSLQNLVLIVICLVIFSMAYSSGLGTSKINLAKAPSKNKASTPSQTAAKMKPTNAAKPKARYNILSKALNSATQPYF